jgi:GNAT superfamily N-acetyltransferase
MRERTFTIRPVEPEDDLGRITELIHAAYALHAARGLRYWATYQSQADTAERFASGSGLVAVDGRDYVGTITVRPPRPDSPVALYRQPDVWTVEQFCVAPAWQGSGLGRALHDQAVSIARRAGASCLALDTASAAHALIAMYERWGYQVVGKCDWRPNTNYVSVVMSCGLVERPGTAQGRGSGAGP